MHAVEAVNRMEEAWENVLLTVAEFKMAAMTTQKMISYTYEIGKSNTVSTSPSITSNKTLCLFMNQKSFLGTEADEVELKLDSEGNLVDPLSPQSYLPTPDP